MFEHMYSLANVASSLGYPLDIFIKAWTGPDDQACRGDITPRQMWRECLEALNYSGEIADLTDQWVDGFTPNLRVHQLALEVSRHCAVGVLSNLYKDIYPILLRRGLIPNINWNVIVLSSDIRSRKPEPNMYQEAEMRAGKRPEQLVVLDDKLANVYAARARDWRGILFDSTNPQSAINEVLRLSN